MSSRNDARLPFPVPDGGFSVSFSDTSARTSAGMGAGVSEVFLWADEDCYIRFGGSGVAATNDDFPLQAGMSVYLRIRPGQYIAALRMTVSGTLYGCEMTY